MTELSDIVNATYRNRANKLTNQVDAANRMVALIAQPSKPPTMWQRVGWHVRDLRERIGFWIAGREPGNDW